MMMHHRNGRMKRTQRACWLFLALVKSSSGFTSPQPSCSSLAPSCPQVQSHRQTTTPLYLVTEDDADGAVAMTAKKKGPFRRAVRKILRRKRTDKGESMHMLTEEAQQTELSQDFVKGLRLPDQVNADFILQNFQTTSPNDVFPTDTNRRNVLIATDQDGMRAESSMTSNSRADLVTMPTTIAESSLTTVDLPPLRKTKQKKSKSPKASSSTASPSNKFQGGTFLHRMTRSWFQNLLTNIIHQRSRVPPIGLSVRVAPIVSKLCRGQFRCDALVEFERVVFRNLRLTGGSLEAKHLAVGVCGVGPRYASQFDIHAHNCTLTEDDLFESSCIRNGLARLLVRILRNAGIESSKIQVTSLNIVPSGKISCSGQADTVFGSQVSFEVRSGLGCSSRGHIITFPGLEVSLGPSLGVFVPVVPEIDLDIGHNARLRRINVDGRRRRVTLSASTTVTPTHTMKLAGKYRQDKDSYAAQFSFDVGRWVTNLGNFTN